MQPAIAILEFDSIAGGIEAGDAMSKRSPVEVLRAGTVHPGKYLVLVGGLTADVEEALDEGRVVGAASLTDVVYLPDVHPDVVESIGGARRREAGEALGVVETRTVAAAVRAADAGVKEAEVSIRDLRLADDLGGKGYVLFGGPVSEVEAAVERAAATIKGDGSLVASVVVPRLDAAMDENLAADPQFLARVAGVRKETA